MPILSPETDTLLLDSAKEGNKFATKDVPEARVDLGTACIQSEPVILLFSRHINLFIENALIGTDNIVFFSGFACFLMYNLV